MMIYDWSRKQAELNGAQIAVSLNNEYFTYSELEAKSNQLAGKLIAEGFKPGDRAGLFLEKTPQTVVAMLGVSKAGGVYVPLDINSPAERVSRIIKSSQASILFIDHISINSFQDLLHLEPSFSFTPWVWWAESPMKYADDNSPLFSYQDIENQKDYPYQVVRNENAIAHILFTSGSTGLPKGVMITHKNIIYFVEWGVSYFNMKLGENTSCHAPLHFDLSTFDLFGAFAVGAHVHLVPLEISLHPKKMVRFFIDNKLDQWFSVPSVLNYLAHFKAIPEGGFPDLKRLIWCGEVFPTPALQYWMKSLKGVEFTNLYGPTETTIASSYYTLTEIPDDLTDTPIGEPCGGERMLVLDEDLRTVNQGEIGDLYIAGVGLSPGYWQDEEKTNEVFIPYTNDEGKRELIYKTGDLASVNNEGLFLFHGRSDYQIKSRGYRIELGEIEAALGQNDLLREYAVVPVIKNGFEGASIGCAYVSSETSNENLSPQLRKLLREKVPFYMLPHYWKEYTKLPRNANGKIDRRRLSDDFENQ